MKYRNLGKWGLKVSEVALGSWVTQLAGSDAQEKAKETVNAAFDLGVNFFDCADAYSGGEAERFLGRCLREHARNEYVVSTKVYALSQSRTTGGFRASTSSNNSINL